MDRVELIDGETRGWVGSEVFSLPPQPPAASSPRFVQFSPTDVILSRQDVSGISARNHLRGRACQITQSKQAFFIAIDIGQIVWVEVTPAAVRELDLRPGAEVVCLLKTYSLRVAE